MSFSPSPSLPSDLYGSSIQVTRTLHRSGGHPYKIFNSGGKIVSRAAKEVKNPFFLDSIP